MAQQNAHLTRSNLNAKTSVSSLDQESSPKNDNFKNKKETSDIYQIVTDKIIKCLENGVKPWVCPWQKVAINFLPENFKTKERYSGLNVFLLWLEALEKGYSSNYWLTYKQAQEMGANVKKGEKGTLCIFYKLWEKENKETKEIEKIPVLNRFYVFNLDQIENIEKPEQAITAIETQNEFLTLEHVEQAIKETNINIKHDGNNAYYSVNQDLIVMPKKELFNNSHDYYATLWHELTHATGHESRLDRKLKNKKGDKDYAFEELIAEMGAAFSCAHLGIMGDVQHESYIAAWLERLNNDKTFIFKAASYASKAHKFLFDIK